MRVLFAPDRFGPSLPAAEAAAALAAGWRNGAPHDELTVLPMSAGGPGLVEVLAGAVGGQMLAVSATGPHGTPVPAALLELPGTSRRPRTVVVEAAQVVGEHLVAVADRDPGRLSSLGVGELLEAARRTGARRVVVGLGSSAVHDGGAGMLAALGAGPRESLAGGGLALAELTDDALPGMADVRRRWQDVELIVLTDADLPLLGLQGASAVEAEARGASAQQAQDLERALGRWVEVVARALPPVTDLLTGRPRRVEREPGAGADGGLGYGLFLLGAHRRGGAAEVAELVGLEQAVADTDLVVTGELRFDWTSLRGGVVTGVAQAAEAAARPSLVLAGEAVVGRREAMGAGLSAVYALSEGYVELPEGAQLAAQLGERAGRLARTWSPAPRGARPDEPTP